MVRKYLVTEDELQSATVTPGGELTFTRDNGEVITAGVVKGQQGDEGPQGLPGVNAVPNDTATAANIDNPATQTRAATDRAIRSNVEINARARLAIGENSASDRAALQASFADAATAGAPLSLRGNFLLTGGTVQPTSAVQVDAQFATLTQADNLRPTVVLPSNSVWRGGRIVGKGSDWVNGSSVYAASAITIASAATDVRIESLVVRNMAGAGVDARNSGRGLRIINPDFEGSGSSAIPAETGQYSGGLVANALTDFEVRGGTIRGFAQGIVTGAATDFFIGGGLRVSCVGQHGIYLTEVRDGLVDGVRIIDVPLQGFKTQIASDPLGSESFTLSNITVKNAGSHAVLITNVQGTPTLVNKRVIISNIVANLTGKPGDVINLQRVDGVIVSNVIGVGGAVGLRLTECAHVAAHHSEFRGGTKSGVRIFNTTDSTFDGINVIDPAGADDATDRFGFYVLGPNTARLRFVSNTVQDNVGLGQYAFFLSTGAATTELAHNTAYGMDYGYRGEATSTKMWLGNDLQGTTARFFNTPPNAANVVDTSGATLAALETEVNKVKQRLRDFKAYNA